MSLDERWLLPEGIEELIGPDAARLERMRRELLDLYATWGYELVLPPFIEFIESLVVGTARDLDLQTFRITDQVSGRQMGVRADITPQVARIDAHRLRREVPTRLCYMGTVLRTRGDGMGGTRSPLQIGAELFGHAGYESDLEVLLLMIETLRAAGLTALHLDLGHVGIFRRLVDLAGLDAEAEAELFDALQRKALPELDTGIEAMPAAWRRSFATLADASGAGDMLARVEAELGLRDEPVQQAFETLNQVAAGIAHRAPGVSVNFDLAELRGYRYHSGLVFAAYVPGCGQAVANGGRYDEVGRLFGRARPATGFSADLKALLALAPAEAAPARGILAPQADDPALDALVESLRGAGERVLRALPGAGDRPREMGCDRQIVLARDGWTVSAVEG